MYRPGDIRFLLQSMNKNVSTVGEILQNLEQHFDLRTCRLGPISKIAILTGLKSNFTMSPKLQHDLGLCINMGSFNKVLWAEFHSLEITPGTDKYNKLLDGLVKIILMCNPKIKADEKGK